MTDDAGTLMKSLEWVLDIDPQSLIASVAAERAQSPMLSNRQLAELAFSRAQWKATLTGIATGLPANPWMSLPAATLDVAATLKVEVLAAARTAIIYNERFFDEESVWKLLIPVFGINVASQALRELGVRGAMGLTRSGIEKCLGQESFRAFKTIMLRYFGILITQKGVITKTLPVVGALVGGTWNYLEVRRIKNRTIRYFENQDQ